MPGFRSLPYGKTLGLGDWICVHLIPGQPLPFWTSAPRGALKMKWNSRGQEIGARD